MTRFQPLEFLGQGATGQVQKALDSQGDVLVALKMPPVELAGEALGRFNQAYAAEAAILRGLSHPVLLTLHAQGHDEGRPFIAYEYLKGQTLRALIAAGQTFIPAQVGSFLGPLLDGVHYLHQQGIVHRDINPNNLILVTEGTQPLRLIDFGAAVSIHQPFSSPVVGTPQYMAPEQLQGAQPDPRADLFSVGVVAYELLTGRPPFIGNSYPEVLQAISAGQYTPPSQVKPTLDATVDSFFKIALCTDPAGRFQTAGAMRAALANAFGTGEASQVAPRAYDESPYAPPSASSPHAAPAQRAAAAASELGNPQVAHLTALSGPFRGQVFTLGGGITTLGGPHADINLSQDLQIAPQHCWVLQDAGRYWLYDADDSGGTRLNQQWIRRAPLLDGDVIEVGVSSFRFADPDQALDAVRPSGSVEFAPEPDTRKDLKRAAASHQAPPLPPRRSPVPTLIGGLLLLLLVAALAVTLIVPGMIRQQMTADLQDTWTDLEPVLKAQTEAGFLIALSGYDSTVNGAIITALEPPLYPGLAFLPPIASAQEDAGLMLDLTRTINDAFAGIASTQAPDTDRLSPATLVTAGSTHSELSTFSFRDRPWSRYHALALSQFSRLTAGIRPQSPDAIPHPLDPFIIAFQQGMEQYRSFNYPEAFKKIDESLVGTDAWFRAATAAEQDLEHRVGPAPAGDVARVLMAICEITEAQMRVVDYPPNTFTREDLDTYKGWIRDADKLLKRVDREAVPLIAQGLGAGFDTTADREFFDDQIDAIDERIDQLRRQLDAAEGGDPEGSISGLDLGRPTLPGN